MNRREAIAGIAGCGVALKVSTAVAADVPTSIMETPAAESLLAALRTCVRACDNVVARARGESALSRDDRTLPVTQCMECRARCRAAVKRIIATDVQAELVPASDARSAAILQACADACGQTAMALRWQASVSAAECEIACHDAATACHEFILS